MKGWSTCGSSSSTWHEDLVGRPRMGNATGHGTALFQTGRNVTGRRVEGQQLPCWARGRWRVAWRQQGIRCRSGRHAEFRVIVQRVRPVYPTHLTVVAATQPAGSPRAHTANSPRLAGAGWGAAGNIGGPGSDPGAAAAAAHPHQGCGGNNNAGAGPGAQGGWRSEGVCSQGLGLTVYN